MSSNILPYSDMTFYHAHFMKRRNTPFIFRTGFVTGNEHVCVPNLHRDVELIFVIEGQGQFICGNEKTDIQPGDLAIASSYTMHSITSAETIRYFYLIVDCDLCKVSGVDMETLRFPPMVRDEQAQQLFSQIVQEYRHTSEFQNLAIRAVVFQLLVLLCRNYSAPKTTMQPDNVNQSMRRAMEFMKQNLSKKLSVEEIAASAGFSKYYFLRLFKQHTGYTVNNYLNTLRCDHARQLLLSGKCSVKEAAELSGFDSPSYFTKVFKTFVGRSPSEFLK